MEKKLCLCGCGNELKGRLIYWENKIRKEKRFLLGHGLKGKKFSEEHKEHLRVSALLRKQDMNGNKNPFYGRKHSQITINKLTKYSLNDKEVIKIYQKLKNIHDVSKVFGCSISPIKRVLKRNNIKLNNKPYSAPGKKEHLIQRMKAQKYGLGYKPSKEIIENLRKRFVGSGNPQYGLKGPLSPNWKGNLGITQVNKRLRQSEQYIGWRNGIFKRDNYTCQDCKAKPRYVEAHHKIPLWKILQLNDAKKYEETLKIEQLWDINNGITLCVPCHKLLDPDRNRFFHT